MNNELQKKYDFACELAEKAGAIAKDYQDQLRKGNLEIDVKGHQDFVSDADRETERYIRNQIESTYPEDGFLGEESGATAESCAGVWVVDPIDGTTNFLRKQSAWCVSIAYVVNGEPVIGVIYDPSLDELFHALKGEGAYLNDRLIEVYQGSEAFVGLVNLGYSPKMSLENYLNTMQRLLNHGIEHRRHGSAALGLAHVAAGRFDGYREDFINAWDIMAGVVILREAKADVTAKQIEGGYAIQASIPAITALLAG
ncbi:inositol monophosphatase [Vibrio sp. SCSIO 43140]|uniref:inositol monophosphatase family protein n=1 Tax=Vibrio sp. SCSIO 43140 TaxID=2819100 RepID=UPI0020757A40|nr:inositol monophosphatase family protein [Vibrio sp. SCSIO 43140]USD61244.1 inositol monophosphatase [Vibrio sp. SCSIO 43140]